MSNFSDEVIGQSRHQFIYGENGNKREEILRGIVRDNPIVMDENVPGSIYLENDYLMSGGGFVIDKYRSLAASREHFMFAITGKLLEDALSLDIETRSDEFLSRINRLFVNSEHGLIEDLDSLVRVLYQARDFYRDGYKSFLETGIFPSIECLPIQFMDLNSFMHCYKKLLNNKSYFSVIVDQQVPISTLSKRAINDVVGRRINGDISMKVACQPGEWETFFDLNGQLVEATHDYGVVELDDSFNQYVKKIKRETMGE